VKKQSHSPLANGLDKVRNEMIAGHNSPRTEEAYTGWIKRFVL